MSSLATLEKQIGKVERAAACAMCELIKRYTRRTDALIAEVAATKPAESGDDLKAYTSRSFCAWCGRVEMRDYKAAGDLARDLEMIWRAALNDGRACSAEFVAAFDRNDASLREWFGPRVADYEAIYSEFSAECRTLPPPRFPYACSIEGCRCRHPKRAAA